jgi:hypothetical protein
MVIICTCCGGSFEAGSNTPSFRLSGRGVLFLQFFFIMKDLAELDDEKERAQVSRLNNIAAKKFIFDRGISIAKKISHLCRQKSVRLTLF